jgi:predicted amino acid racemase
MFNFLPYYFMGGAMRMVSPGLEIDLGIIRHNTVQVVTRCHQKGIAVLGVTKGFSAIPEIVAAMVQGGVDGLADSRMENIIELRELGFNQPMTLLRIPRLSNVDLVVQHADTSVNSEITVVRALAQAAQSVGKTHKIILMVDVGDLREGVLQENVISTARQISRLQGIKLVGLGTNMGCFGGILPSSQNLGQLVELGKMVENQLELELEILSGGGSSTLMLLENDAIPAGINQLRIGESILLGTDTTNYRRIPWLCSNAFLLTAEVIELKTKPSVPIGDVGRDAFGNIPQFEDIGDRKRAILALGKQDVYIEGIIPVDEQIVVLGASSDHLIVDVTDYPHRLKVGDTLTFRLTYAGLVAVSQSKYITRYFKGEAHA